VVEQILNSNNFIYATYPFQLLLGLLTKSNLIIAYPYDKTQKSRLQRQSRTRRRSRQQRKRTMKRGGMLRHRAAVAAEKDAQSFIGDNDLSIQGTQLFQNDENSTPINSPFKSTPGRLSSKSATRSPFSPSRIPPFRLP
jgi:hypothetical protein